MPSLGDSLFGDELSTYFIVTDNYVVPGEGLDRVMDIVRSDQEITPPLYFLLAWIAHGVGGTTEWLRLPSLVAGVAAPPLTYLLGVWTVGRRAALLGALLMALSPFLIFYSTEARAYALMLLLVLLSTLALLRALDTGQARWWVLYGALSCAVIYTHYTAIFVLAAQLGWAFWTRPDSRGYLLLSNGVAVLAFAPWLPGFIEDRDFPGNVLGAVHPFTLEVIRNDLGQLFTGNSILGLSDLPGRPAIALIVLGLATGGIGVLARHMRAARNGVAPRPSSRAVLVILLAAATPVGLALASLVGDTVWTHRNLIASWPGLALALGALLSSAPGTVRIAAVSMVVAGLSIGSVKMVDPDYQRPDYQGAAQFIAENGSSGDPVLEFPFSHNPATALEVAMTEVGQSTMERPTLLRARTPSHAAVRRAYAQGRLNALYPPLPFTPDDRLWRQAGRLARDGRLFVVIPDASLEVRDPSTALEAAPSRFREVESRTFPGMIPVSVHVLQDTHSR